MSVALPSWIPPDHPARWIILDQRKQDICRDTPRSNAAETQIRFTELLLKREPRNYFISEWERVLDTVLIGVAVLGDDVNLYVAHDGRCFGWDLINNGFYYFGASISEAIDTFLEGRRARPVLRPGEPSIIAYGQHFARGDSFIYDPLA